MKNFPFARLLFHVVKKFKFYRYDPSGRDRTSDIQMSMKVSNYSLTLFQLSYRRLDDPNIDAETICNKRRRVRAKTRRGAIAFCHFQT